MSREFSVNMSNRVIVEKRGQISTDVGLYIRIKKSVNLVPDRGFEPLLPP